MVEVQAGGTTSHRLRFSLASPAGGIDAVKTALRLPMSLHVLLQPCGKAYLVIGGSSLLHRQMLSAYAPLSASSCTSLGATNIAGTSKFFNSLIQKCYINNQRHSKPHLFPEYM